MTLECNFCKKTFSTKSNLLNHQKKAKYCLKIQKQMDISNNESVEINFKCEYCQRSFSTKRVLNNHKNVCLEYYKYLVQNNSNNNESKLIEKDEIIENQKEDISNLEKKVIELEAKLEIYKEQGEKSFEVVEQIAKQPKQQVNNNQKITINTPLDLSSSTVYEAIQNGFNHDHLTLGQKGVAQFAYNNILKDEKGKLMYICTDPSRQIFQYKNEEGKIQKDVRATKLTRAILDASIKQTSHKIAWDNMKDGDNEIFMAYTNHYQDIQGLEQDNSEFSKELICLTVK